MNQKTNPKICVVGSAMIDLVIRTPRLPEPGETIIGSSFQTGFGGKGSNQAIMAARLGSDVSMVTKLGRDSFGVDTLNNYRQHGLNTDFVYSSAKESTGVAQIWVEEKSGQNSIIIAPGANMTLTRDEIVAADEVIASSDVVICQMEVSPDATRQALTQGRKHGALTILNPAPAAPISDDVLGSVDICVPNETEAKMITDVDVHDRKSAADAGRVLLGMGVKTVIVTLGKSGAVVVTNDQEDHIPAIKVDPVDSTGAGDAFIGTLAVQLANKESLRSAVKTACDVATMSVLKEGTQTSFPTLEEARRNLPDYPSA